MEAAMYLVQVFKDGKRIALELMQSTKVADYESDCKLRGCTCSHEVVGRSKSK